MPPFCGKPAIENPLKPAVRRVALPEFRWNRADFIEHFGRLPEKVGERALGVPMLLHRRGAVSMDGVMLRRARLFLFGSGFFFGLLPVFTRLATRAPGGMSGPQVALIRYVFGIMLVGAIFWARPGTFKPVRHGLLISRGTFGGIAGLLYFGALALIPAGEATLLNTTFPIWAVVISILFLGERPRIHLLIALAVASVGVFLVLRGNHTALALGRGQLLAILSAVSGGAAVTNVRALRATDNTPTIFFAFSTGGALVSIPFVLGSWTAAPSAWIFALVAALVALVAQMLMTEAYGELSVAEAALWQQLTPVMSFLLGMIIGERVTSLAALGVAVSIFGVIYGSLFGTEKTQTDMLDTGSAS